MDDQYIDPAGGIVDTRTRVSSNGPVSAAQYGPDVQGGNPVGTEYQGRTVDQMRVTADPSTSIPRPPQEQASAKESPGLGNIYSERDDWQGPITAAASTLDQEQPAGISGVRPDYNAQIQLANAQDRQDANDRSQSAARIAAAPSSRDIERMQSEARVANFHLANAGLDAAGHIGRNPRAAIGVASTIAADSRGALNAATAQNQAAVVNPQRNYVQDAIASQQALTSGQVAQSQIAQSGVATQEAQQRLQQQQRINEVSKLLVAAKTPEEQRQHSNNLLALLGKDKPEDYQVIHAAGATSIDPGTGLATKAQDNVVIINKRTGQRDIVPLNQLEHQAPQYEKGKVYKDSRGNKATWDGTKFVAP